MDERKAQRRENGEGTFWQSADGYWRGQITIAGDGGKQKRKTVSAKTKKDVLEKLRKVREDAEKNLLLQKDTILFRDWHKRFLEKYCKVKIRQTTLDKYESLSKIHLYPHLGEIQLQKVATGDIQNLISSVSGKLASRSVHEIALVLNLSFKQAISEKIVLDNPMKSVVLPKVEEKQKKALDLEQIDDLIERTKEHRFFPAVLLGLFGGLRRGEILALEVKDLYVRDGTCFINVYKNYVKTALGDVITLPKTKTSIREIAVPSFVFAEIQKKIPKNGYLFQTQNGTIVSPRNLARFFKVTFKSMGLSDFSIHSLRHTYATQLIASGGDLKSVQSQLGHADMRQANRYSHKVSSAQIATVGLLENNFSHLFQSSSLSSETEKTIKKEGVIAQFVRAQVSDQKSSNKGESRQNCKSSINFSINRKKSGHQLSAETRVVTMVGLGGLEPQTSSMSTKRSNQLSYNPLFSCRWRNYRLSTFVL